MKQSLPARAVAPTPTPTPPRLQSETLFAGARMVIIVHGTRQYQLRITSSNKLILTA